MKNTENIKEFLKESGEPECFIVATDKGCSFNATISESLTLITCLVSELKNSIPKNMIKKAVDLGFEVDRNDNTNKEIKKMDKELENLEKKIKKITDLIKEL